jgi:uncharacterized membrane protein YbhN (UPF0104 family)
MSPIKNKFSFNVLGSIKISGKLIVTTSFGLTILFFLFFNVDIKKFLIILNDINPIGFVGIGFFILLQSFFRAVRFSSIVKKDFRLVYLISAVHSFMNKILPFRTGELTWPIMMKNYLDVSFTKTVAALLFLRILDVGCILSFLTISLLIVDNVISNTFIISILIVFLLCIFISILKINYFIQILITVAQKIGSGAIHKNTNKMIEKLSHLSDFSKTIDYHRFLFFAFIQTACVWATLYFTYFLFIRMFEVEFSFIEVVLGGSLVAFFTNFPINGIGRFGTFELAWSSGYVLLGLDPNIAIPLGFCINVSTLLITGIVASVSFLLLNAISR